MEAIPKHIKNKKGEIFLGKKGSTIDDSHLQFKFFKTWAYVNKDKLEKYQ